jgi:hypothetical protein
MSIHLKADFLAWLNSGRSSMHPVLVRRIGPALLFLGLAVLLGSCAQLGRHPTPTVERIMLTPPERISPTDTRPVEPPPPAVTAASTSTLTRKQARQTKQAQLGTPTPTQPHPTSTPSQPPENILIYRPFDLATGIPADVKPGSALLLSGAQAQILHFVPEVRLETLPGVDTACLSASPDGKWIASCPLSDESSTGRWLMVDSASRQQHLEVPMNIYLISFGFYDWLDNQHLIFPLVRASEPFNSMVAINPFTGEHTDLASNYPGIVASYAGSAGTMSFVYSDVVYDPALNLVIFPGQRGSQKYITLWNRQTSAVVAEVEDKGKFLHYPIWSPDAGQFVVTARQLAKGGNYGEEWFSVSREGQVQQLTHFGEYFRTVKIGADANWSPDGQKLAFWLKTTPGACQGVNLAVLEMSTLQVTNTCIPGVFGYSKPPVWSLDSRYISVLNNAENAQQAFLVDFVQGRVFDITKYGVPVGWLAIP